MRISGRWFSLGILGLAFILGLSVMFYSWQIPQETKEIDSGLEGGDTVPLVEVYELHKDVLVDKNEYALNETIVAKAVIVNDGSSPVRIRPPSVFSATGYSVGSTDERVSQGVSITWAESEIEIPANASMVLCSFSFRGEEPGPFLIRISGFPEKEIDIVEPRKELNTNYTVQADESNTTKYYSYSNLTVTPRTIGLDENVTISFEITNILRRAADFAYAIHVEGPDYSYAIMGATSLEGYETKTISHIEAPDAVGTYKVSVGEMDAYFHVVSSIITVNGTLGSKRYPVPWFGSAPPALGEKPTHRVTDVLVLETLDSKRFFLECDCRTNMLLTNSTGNYVVGGLTLDEWNDAYREGKTVEIDGYVRVETIDDVEYLLLHILTARNTP